MALRSLSTMMYLSRYSAHSLQIRSMPLFKLPRLRANSRSQLTVSMELSLVFGSDHCLRFDLTSRTSPVTASQCWILPASFTGNLVAQRLLSGYQTPVQCVERNNAVDCWIAALPPKRTTRSILRSTTAIVCREERHLLQPSTTILNCSHVLRVAHIFPSTSQPLAPEECEKGVAAQAHHSTAVSVSII